MPAAAVAGAALVGSVYSANKQKSAAKDAASAQTKASAGANKIQWDMYSQSRQDNEPFRQNALTAQQQYMQFLGLGAPQQAQTQQAAPQFGNAGLFNGMTTGGLAQGQQIGGTSQGGGIAGLLGHADGDMRVQHNGFGPIMQQAIARGNVPATGIPGGAMPTQQQGAPQTGAQGSITDLLRATPGYQWNLDQGQKQLDSSAAARGGFYSGAMAKDTIKYGQNYADRIFGDHMNRLGSVANMGQVANSQNQQAGMNYANQAGMNLGNAANARASGLQSSANATSNMWGNVAGIGGWLAGQYANRPPATGGGYTGFNNTPGGGGFGWLGGGG